MRAAQISGFGGKEVMDVTADAPKPSAGDGEVLIEVHAASVNPFDWKVMSGQAGAQLAFPATLGGDVAGVVAAIGPDVEGFEVGQEVYGQANALGGHGSFAEFTPVKATSLGPKPKNTDFVNAAALPLTAVSAYQALVDTLHLSAGQKILIHGGAGGIGSLAIQLAKHLGAHVSTTAAPEDVDYVKRLGADDAIDYTTEKFEDKIHGFDAVYDTIGGDTYTRSFEVLKPGGQIVSMLEQPNQELMGKYNVTATHQFTKVTPERLASVTKLVEDGVLAVMVDRTYPLDETADALEYLHSTHHRGKVILKIK